MRMRASKIDLPLVAINGNIIFGDGRASAVYRVETRSFEFLSLSEKQELHGRLSWWMIKAEADFSIYRVCREYPADAYVQDTVSLIDERFADRRQWESMLSGHADHMRSMRSFVPEVYFVVSLQSQSRLPWSRPARDVKVLRDAEEATLATLSDHVSARRATTLELQWLVRRAATRGTCEPDVDPHWRPPALLLDGGVWSPGRADVQRFMPAVTENRRSLVVEGEDGESLQSMLVLGKPPVRSDYPGSAELLFAPLESLDFPVDAVAHVRWIPNKKMLAICDNSIKDATDEFEDASARFLNRKIKRRAQEVSDVQDYFDSEPYPPGLETFISFAVGGPDDDPELLSERVKRLRRAYGSTRLYQPFALQSDLFDEHLPRPDGAVTRDYRRDYKRLLVVEQLAAMMPIGANAGGSESCFYIGHTIPGSRRPVRYSPLEASQLNRAGAVLLDGTLGAGKTIAAQLLAYNAARRGSLVVDVDPKPDHSLERLLPDVHVISLNDVERNRGLLDPMIVAPEEMREELTSSYLMEILPSTKHEWQTEIIDSVRAVLREPDPTSMKVVERLLSSEEEHARAAGKALNVWSEWSLGRLAFSYSGGRDVHASRQVTTIKASALTLPMAGTPRANYDQSERISVATLKLIAAYAMRLVSGDRSAHKLLLLDEAHVLTMTADGRRFLERLIRMGRSMNVTVMLSTQLVGDLAELEQLIGVRFAFRQETDEQARLNLRMLGLDEDKRLVDMLRGFSDGRCLMRGLDGRVVAMRFDPVDPEILRVADTNPTRLEQALMA